MRSLREPAEAPVLECVGRYCQLRQGERLSQPHLESDHTGYQALALHGSAPYQTVAPGVWGAKNPVTLPGRTREAIHRDGSEARDESRPARSPAPPRNASDEVA